MFLLFPYYYYLFVNVKCKGKVVPVLLTEHQALKAYWGIESIIPLIL
jgi:hypothetical protein